jgi:excisionase family DNA binding protein
MAKVFKITVTTYLDPAGSKCKKADAVHDASGTLRPGYQVLRRKTTSWYGKFTDAGGRVRRVPLCPDKTASAQILAKLVADAAKGKHGLVDPYELHRARPLADHLADFDRELETKGDSPSHRKQVISRLEKAFKGCGFLRLDDLSAAPLKEWLANLRVGGKPRVTLDPDKEFFAVREVAVILQVKPPAIRALVHRHRLEATGQGKARRFSKATVEALQDRLCQGISVQTSNYFVTHLRTFGRWLVRNRRLPDNPFILLETGRTQLDRRHDRRELTTAQMRSLYVITLNSQRSFRGLTGEDRAILYATAAGTGFRASALASLTPESFHLDGESTAVVLSARFNKNRKPRTQPLPDDLADLLRDYLREKPKEKLVWGGTWASDHRGAEMLRKDLQEAGIPYVVEGPDGPLFADFHAFRHTYLTGLRRGGVDLRTAQELAGHSSPVLTARYSHRWMDDKAREVQKLPRFLPQKGEGKQAADQVCPRLDQNGDVSGQEKSAFDTVRASEVGGLETTQPPAKQGVGHRQTVPVSSVHKRGRRDSNPQPPDRQARMLTCLKTPLTSEKIWTTVIRPEPFRYSILSIFYGLFSRFPGSFRTFSDRISDVPPLCNGNKSLPVAGSDRVDGPCKALP